MIISRSGSNLDRIVLIDGYVDEPTCLGVPPYISIYPRYIAGAIWKNAPKTEIVYQTIDQIRATREEAFSLWTKSDLLILIAGMIVPGKYLGGTPISVKETKWFFSNPAIDYIPKLLVGPWARFGCGLEGGRLALSSNVLSPPFDFIIRGDSETVIAELVQSDWNLENLEPDKVRDDFSEIEDYAQIGARIVEQHPGFSRSHIICEIETYRGCPRFLTGGCSFCVEPLYGEPQQRAVKDILREIESLYSSGIRAFRIGRQADLFTYGSHEMGTEEFPQPNPAAIEALFSGIRNVAPELDVLHIDNVNPGTIVHHPEESRVIAKHILRYHTPGDVAAFGLESLDPEVRKRNNLKVDEEEALEAVRLLNEMGSQRSPRGFPHLLPGINLLYGLPGEGRQTAEYNLDFLHRLLEEGLIVRRINVRQVIGFPDTLLADKKSRGMKQHEFFRHKKRIREEIDTPMLKRVAPSGTIIPSVFSEGRDGNHQLLRPLGTYPILCHLPVQTNLESPIDVFVVDHGPRSVTVLPFPLRVSEASLAQWKAIPGIGAKRATRIRATQSLSNIDELEARIDAELPEWLHHSLSFK
jgi:radical SAM superfamily enzyme with C-terminal helix-hairpin-helix motif